MVTSVALLRALERPPGRIARCYERFAVWYPHSGCVGLVDSAARPRGFPAGKRRTTLFLLVPTWVEIIIARYRRKHPK